MTLITLVDQCDHILLNFAILNVTNHMAIFNQSEYFISACIVLKFTYDFVRLHNGDCWLR